MAGTRALDQQELEDILNGSCILGCGGGGPLAIGQQLLQEIREMGLPVTVIDVAEVPDDAMLCVAAVEGSPTAAGSGPFPWGVAVTAVNKLEQVGGKHFDYILPAEVGAGNTFIALITAARLGIPVIDASGAPRAVPTLTMVKLVGAPVGPIVLADDQQSVVVDVPDAAAAEVATREIIGGGIFPEFAGVALWSMSGATVKQVGVSGTLTEVQQLGRALREAKSNGADPVEAVRGALHGRVVFIGEALQFQEQTAGGFDDLSVGLTSLDGRRRLTIYAQNENLIAWDSTIERPLAMIPDLICCLTTDGQPFSNADLALAQNKRVAVIAAPVNPSFLVQPVIDAALDVLGTIHYAGPYVPLESSAHRSQHSHS